MLEGRTYVPLLHARLAEMRALRELPTATKNLMLPIIRVRPWLNSKKLAKVFDVVADAFGDRAFGLDLDSSKFVDDSEKPAQQEFSELFNQNDGYSAYYACVEGAANRIPVMRVVGGVTHHLQRQIDHVERLDRGAFYRMDVANPGDYMLFAETCVERGIENVVFVIDCGWRTDVLVRAANCVPIVNALAGVSDEFEVVVAGSSFPDSFSGIGARANFPISERVLFQNVRQNTNFGRLYYGDWGSTRPPAAPVPMTNVPRIDIARRSDWVAWRSEDGESYEEIAERVVSDPAWTSDSGLWGDYMIASTAEGLEPAIRAPAMAAAVRVNLHLNTQARFNEPGGVVVEDEPVGDDL
jgi:hypothetical protein